MPLPKSAHPAMEERDIEEIFRESRKISKMCTDLLLAALPQQGELSLTSDVALLTQKKDGQAVFLLAGFGVGDDVLIRWTNDGLAMMPEIQVKISNYLVEKLLNSKAPTSITLPFIEDNLLLLVNPLAKKKILDDMHLEEYYKNIRSFRSEKRGTAAGNVAVEKIHLIRKKWAEGEYSVQDNTDGSWARAIADVLDALIIMSENMSERFTLAVRCAAQGEIMEGDISGTPKSMIEQAGIEQAGIEQAGIEQADATNITVQPVSVGGRAEKSAALAQEETQEKIRNAGLTHSENPISRIQVRRHQS
jgi:hypothetical protein